jgi:ATP-dependent helicase/nuclease subunit A
MCVTDGDISRPVGYGDIVILLRSLKDKEEVYINALKQAGIPAAAQKAVSIFENPEISLLLSLLTVIDNPMQDVPLIAFLRSPLVGFTADELAEIRACDLSADFYTALGKMAARSEKCAAFLKRLKDFRDRAADFATDRLLRYLYDETGLPGIAAAESPGAASRLLLLLDYARQFEEKGYKGLFSFITHLNDLAEQDDLPLKISGSGSGQEVLITSIHSSKGLEYPVVFLADLSKKFNKEDTKKPLLIHRDLGAGPKKLDTRRRIEYPTLARLGIAAKIAEESLSEEMRVLYVGMTRAREKLITVLSLKDAEDKLRKLSCFAEYPLSPQTLENCESLGDWLLLAALDQRESIVICRPETQCAGEAEAEENAAIVPSLELIDQLRMKLRYTYPHQNAAMLPSKLTATELKGDFFTEEAAENAEKVISAATETVFRRPRFTMEEKGLTSAERGTALHLVMQYIDFQRCGDLEGIASEIRRLGEARMITPEQRDAVRTEPIHRFLQSPLGQRVRNAKALNREFKVSLLTPARDILPEGGEDQVLLQGVVDLCMENGNGLTVVDFKTDDVTQATQKDRAEAYRGQLKAYALAMERIFGAPVTERLVYFFTTGTAVAL